MPLTLIVIIGIGVLGAGAYLRLTNLLYITVAFLAGFAAISLTRACFGVLTAQLATVTAKKNAAVISFILLALVPALLICFAGRKVITKITAVALSPLIDAILGSAYAISVYIALLQII